MIASDTSSFSAFLKGETGLDVDWIASALAVGELCLPPVVLTELVSDPDAAALIVGPLSDVALLPVLDGYWRRAGDSRRLVLLHGRKAKIADALIAQSCIDHGVALITRDSDFRHFARHCGLRLA